MKRGEPDGKHIEIVSLTERFSSTDDQPRPEGEKRWVGGGGFFRKFQHPS